MMKNKNTKGFTLFIAITLTATILLVSMAIVSVAVKEIALTSAGRESQYAFYAADTGIECALYWDVKNPSGYSAFSTSTASSIYCNKDINNPSNQFTVGGTATSTILQMTFLPDPYCATVTVNKSPSNATTIESHGYNTCSSTNLNRVERAVRVIY